MDVTGGLSDAVNKITAALPGLLASGNADAAALLTQAQATIQSEIDRMEADGERLITAMQAAAVKLLGAESVAALAPVLLGATDLTALLERGIIISLRPPTNP